MRDKHHLVLDNCTTYTHKKESKLWLQQTTRSLSLWRLKYSSRRICHYTYQSSTLLCLQQIVYTHDDRTHLLIPYFVQVEAGGHFSDYVQNLLNSDSGNSLISLPPAHIWPSRHPQAPAVCHRWACNCSVAWSCSEWLGESSLTNEASQCDASPLLRNICVCVCMQVCGTTYIWYAAIIQHSCLLHRQRREERELKF